MTQIQKKSMTARVAISDGSEYGERELKPIAFDVDQIESFFENMQGNATVNMKSGDVFTLVDLSYKQFADTLFVNGTEDNGT